MPVSAARAAAFDILLRVSREGSFASELLHSERLSALSPEDRGLCTELVMGTLRWQSVLDGAIARESGRKPERLDLEVLVALRIGAYQMAFLERVPARAAANESVELVKRARKRSAVGFANAVLRKLADCKPWSASDNALSSSHEVSEALAHPEWLVERWIRNYGLDRTLDLCRYDQRPPRTVLRLPLNPTARAAAESELTAAGLQLEPGSLVSAARVVRAGNVLGSDLLSRRQIWIQDEASQLVALLVGTGTRLLDCCAAPGGKTALLAERNPDSRIVACELHPHRARLLRERVTAPNVEVVGADARTLPATADYDGVLADVPCSGTGTLARNPEIRWRLRPESLQELRQLQISILEAALQQLAPGGRAVYSTCSMEREEGEDVVLQVTEGRTDFRLLDCGDELLRLRDTGMLAVGNIESLRTGPFLRTIPGVHSCDGFFAAVIQRND